METNIFKTHFKAFSKIAKQKTKYTKQGKPMISKDDPDFNDAIWDDEDGLCDAERKRNMVS